MKVQREECFEDSQENIILLKILLMTFTFKRSIQRDARIRCAVQWIENMNSYKANS